jgi:hypothetical protein
MKTKARAGKGNRTVWKRLVEWSTREIIEKRRENHSQHDMKRQARNW